MPVGEDQVRDDAEAALEAMVDAVPASVRQHLAVSEQLAPAGQVHAVGVALAVTAYILHLGKTIGEEMAATISFPAFPSDEVLESHLGELFHFESEEYRQSRVKAALALFAELRERAPVAAARQGAPAGVDADGQAAEQAADLLFAALLAQPDKRTTQQTVLLQQLPEIADRSVGEGADLNLWGPGLAAVSRIARLAVSQALPMAVGTIDRLRAADPALQLIATLGGAVFLESSIQILVSTSPPSPYAGAGLTLAAATKGYGGRNEIRPAAAGNRDLDDYVTGLTRFAETESSVFLIEHPFHFRVLLEVLSGENRRYPAEPVLNSEALTRVWGQADLWEHFAWSRDQLPVVANELRFRSYNVVFVQHYVAFGRTPLTSSFARLNYATRAPIRPPSWLPWPSAFDEHRESSVRNQPNTVSEVHRAVRRQQSLGRLWRGAPKKKDLRWLAGQLLVWDVAEVHDGPLAERIWDSSKWLGGTFPVDVVSEIRTGAWLLEALCLRLDASVLPADWQKRRLNDAERNQVKEAQELTAVLEIMSIFTERYLTGNGDGIPKLTASLERLGRESWFNDLGPDMLDRLARLENQVSTAAAILRSELDSAEEALVGEPAATLRGDKS